MYMIAATVKGPSCRDLPDAEEFAEVVWAHCERADGIEHIRCMRRPGRIGILLFVQGPDSDRAVAMAQSVCERLVSKVPALNGWYLDSCVDVTEHPPN
jgi:hypothetical protein